jgi:hypothetical protein
MKEKETGVNNVADGKFGTCSSWSLGKVISVDALFGSNHKPKTGIRQKKKSRLPRGYYICDSPEIRVCSIGIAIEYIVVQIGRSKSRDKPVY